MRPRVSLARSETESNAETGRDLPSENTTGEDEECADSDLAPEFRGVDWLLHGVGGGLVKESAGSVNEHGSAEQHRVLSRSYIKGKVEELRPMGSFHMGNSTLPSLQYYLRHVMSLTGRCLATKLRLVRALSTAMAAQVRHLPLSDQEEGAPAEKKQRVEGNQLSLPAPSRTLKKQTRKQKRKFLPEPCSPEDVLWNDVAGLLGSDIVDHKIAQGIEWDAPFSFREELEVEVSKLSSNGT